MPHTVRLLTAKKTIFRERNMKSYILFDVVHIQHNPNDAIEFVREQIGAQRAQQARASRDVGHVEYNTRNAYELAVGQFNCTHIHLRTVCPAHHTLQMLLTENGNTFIIIVTINPWTDARGELIE